MGVMLLMLLLPSVVQAQIGEPSCATLGYNDSAADCDAQKKTKLKCPTNESKIYCGKQTVTCSSLGYFDSPQAGNTCSTINVQGITCQSCVANSCGGYIYDAQNCSGLKYLDGYNAACNKYSQCSPCYELSGYTRTNFCYYFSPTSCAYNSVVKYKHCTGNAKFEERYICAQHASGYDSSKCSSGGYCSFNARDYSGQPYSSVGCSGPW